MTVPEEKPKPLFEVVWNEQKQMPDVLFTADEIITPRVLNKVFKSIKVRYRQYFAKIKKSERIKDESSRRTTAERGTENSGTVGAGSVKTTA